VVKHITILGAGITGLSAGWRLSVKGIKVDIFEEDTSVGGLAKTIHEGDCFIDIGPHSFFSDDKEIINAVLGLFKKGPQPKIRKVKFYYNGRYLDYPLTARSVLFQMGACSGLRAACSFLKARFFPFDRREETVESWAINNFGWHLYRSFFKPYTEQFWKTPCSELSSMAIPTHTRMSFINTLKLLLRQKVDKKGESLIEREMLPVYYPDAGFGEISENIARIIERNKGAVHLGCKVTGISELSGGRMRITYNHEGQQKEMESDYIISTAPLHILLKILAPSAAPDVLLSAGRLEYRSLVVLGMLTNKQNILNCDYAYLLDRPFNRISEMNGFSRYSSSDKENIVCVEIPCLIDSSTWKANKEDLFDICIDSLSKDGFIRRNDVKKLFLVKAPHAYPVYRKDYAVHLARIKGYLKNYKSLISLGRCGEFRYMDIDECMKRAFRFADNLE